MKATELAAEEEQIRVTSIMAGLYFSSVDWRSSWSSATTNCDPVDNLGLCVSDLGECPPVCATCPSQPGGGPRGLPGGKEPDPASCPAAARARASRRWRPGRRKLFLRAACRNLTPARRQSTTGTNNFTEDAPASRTQLLTISRIARVGDPNGIRS